MTCRLLIVLIRVEEVMGKILKRGYAYQACLVCDKDLCQSYNALCRAAKVTQKIWDFLSFARAHVFLDASCRVNKKQAELVAWNIGLRDLIGRFLV